jgi:hypothetical protein
MNRTFEQLSIDARRLRHDAMRDRAPLPTVFYVTPLELAEIRKAIPLLSENPTFYGMSLNIVWGR